MKIFIWSILFFFASSAIAQSDTAVKAKDITNLSLEELLNIEVISSTKKMQPVSEAPSIISVIQLQQLKSIGAITLIDALKFIPSVEVSMGVDGFYRLAIRGTRKEGTVLLLIDGQGMNDFYTGRAIYDLPIDFIEKIEIIRGPGSSIYGTNAMVGVINVITIKNNSISVGGGINSNLKFGANFFKESNKLKVSASIGAQTSKGANALIDTDKVSNYNWSLVNSDKTFRTNRWNNDGYVNVNVDYDNLHIKLFDFARQQGMWLGPLYIATKDSKLFTNQFMSSIAYDYKISDNVIITPKVYSNINQHNFLSQETPNGYESLSGDIFADGKQTKESYLGKTYGLETNVMIKANDNLDLLFGSVFEDLHLAKYDLTRNYQIVGDRNKISFGNYDDIQYDQKDKRRFLSAYTFQGNYKLSNFSLTAGIRYDDYSDFGQSFNPRVGITYNPFKFYSVKGLYGRAFRAPTFNELYDNTTLGNQYGVKGNTKLKPETINTLEFSNEFNFKWVVLKYNLFYIQNTNLIRVYDPHGGGSIGVFTNVGNQITYGHEVEIDIEATKQLYITANYTHYQALFNWDKNNVTSADYKFFEKQPADLKVLTNMPNLRLNLGLTYQIKKVEIFLGANYGNQSFNNNRFYLEQDHYAHIPQYIQGTANIKYKITNKFSANISASNIGKKYSDPDESTNIDATGTKGLIQPTETVLLNLTYKF